MTKEYNNRVISISLPKDLDNYLNLIIENLKKNGTKVNKSKFITTILYDFLSSTIEEAKDNDSKA